MFPERRRAVPHPPFPLNPNVRALEALLARKRRAHDVLDNVGSYLDRFGHHDTAEERARKWEQCTLAAHETELVTRELDSLVERLRQEDPAGVEQWAEAHVALLETFIESCYGDIPSARREIDEWRSVKRGDKPFAEVAEDVPLEWRFYPHTDTEGPDT